MYFSIFIDMYVFIDMYIFIDMLYYRYVHIYVCTCCDFSIYTLCMYMCIYVCVYHLLSNITGNNKIREV